jgi:hypothetical protein
MRGGASSRIERLPVRPFGLRRWLLLTAGLGVLTAAVTWPQIVEPRGVFDLGDPLLNSWELAWVAHALRTQPWHLFDANIFFPEHATLAYSEPFLLPGVLLAPLAWAGVDPIVVHTALMLGGYVLSGLAVFALVRSITGSEAAAVVSAVAFAVYPYRTEAYAHVQLQLAVWLPLVLLSLHRLARQGHWRDGAAAGTCLALQLYTGVYLAIYGSILLGVVGLVLIARAADRRRVALGLVSAIVTAAVLSAPIIPAFVRASRTVGERTLQEVRAGSAEPADYRQPHPDNWLYGDPGRPGTGERRLFPGYVSLALALVSSVPPGVEAVAYLASAAVTADLSLGVNGAGYRWLYDHLWPIRAVRVPARLGLMVGLSLAVLSGLGAARLMRGRGPRQRLLIAAALVALVTVEGRNRPLDLSTLPERRPTVYTWLATQPRGVVCEYPLGNLEGRAGPQDPTYEYYSTIHWMPLVNGYSGFAPPSYVTLHDHLRTFPDAASLSYLQERGVDYLLVHSGFYISGDYERDVVMLRASPRVQWLGAFRWRDGSQTSAFRVTRQRIPGG